MGKTVECPECGEIHRNVPPKYYGKKIRCPNCESILQVPEAKSRKKRSAGRPRRDAAESFDDVGDRRDESQRADSKSRSANRRQRTSSTQDDRSTEQSRPEEPKRRKKKKKKAEKVWSLKRVYFAVCAIIGVVGWCEMAGRYAIDVEGSVPGATGARNALDLTGSGRGFVEISSGKAAADYLYHAIAKIPKFPQVIWHCLTKAWGIPLTLLIIMGGLGGIVYGLTFLDQQLEDEQRNAPKSITLDDPFVHPDDAQGDRPRSRRR